MYKVVQDYIDKLNGLVEKSNGFLEGCSKEKSSEIRDLALNLLNDIFRENDWSEEFVTSFAVYCNFFILNGLYKNLDNNFGLEFIYNSNSMDDDDKEYLEYIRKGIFEQDIVYFENAVNMEIYNFDIPKLYIYILSFLEICLRDEEDFNTEKGRDDILCWLDEMEYFEKEISGELKELVRPLDDLSEEEKEEKLFQDSIFLPEIFVLDLSTEKNLMINSNFETILQICKKKIGDLDNIVEVIDNLEKSKNDNNHKKKWFENIQKLIFGNIYLLIDFGKNIPLYQYMGKDIEDRDNGDVQGFLNLPVKISEREYRNIAFAKQIKLNKEKEILIKKNEKMVEDYSHSVENIMKPALIAEIANCLREDEKNKELYSKIMYVYFNEVITQNECRLLKMVHNMSVTKGAIRESISKAKKVNKANEISIQELVYKAMNQISLQLIENSQKSRYMTILEKMAQVQIDSSMIDNKLWNLSNVKEAIYEMYSQKLNFEVIISEDLQQVKLNEEEVGTSFLYTRIVELISNALTYGDYGVDKKFQLKFYTELTDMGERYIVIQMINKIGERSFSNNREGNGLNAAEVMLERINFENSEKESFVDISETEDGYFVTKMYIDADLYL